MKKLLSFLAIVGLTSTASASVIACSCGAQTDAGPKKVNVDFQIKLTNGTKIYKGMNGTIEIEDYQKQKDLLKDYDLKLVFLPTQADGHPIVKEVGDFDREKGIITIEGLEAGTIKVQVEAMPKSKKASQADQKDAKKISNALEIKVEIASLDSKDSADLFKIPSVKNLVNDNANVTQDEADHACANVKEEVQKVLKVIKGIQIDVDYTINFDPIKGGGNLASGVKLGVQAKVGSKLLKEKSQTQVEVIFQTDTRKKLSEIKLYEITNEIVADNTNVTEDEAQQAQDYVMRFVQLSLQFKVNFNISAENDYTLVNLDDIQAGNLANGVTIQVQAKVGSKLLKGENATELKVNFQSKPKKLSEIKLYEITNEIVADNTNVTEDEARQAQDYVMRFVQLSLQFKVDFNISAENDYTILNLDDIKAGNLANGVTIQVQAKVGSKLLIGGTTTELKVSFQSKPDTRKDLSEIKLPVITNEVDDNANVTTTEADDACTNVKDTVQHVLNGNIDGIQPDDDYTMDLSEIKAGGNLSKGVTITIKANEDSKLVKNDTWTTVEVTFQSKPDTRKSLGDIEFKDKIINEVDDNTKVTSDEAYDACTKVKNEVQKKLKDIINGIQPDDDYTMDLTEIQAGGNLSKGVTITIKANEDSKLVKNDTWTTVEVTFQSKPDTRKSLGDIEFKDKIINEVDDNTKVTSDEAYDACTKVKNEVQKKLKDIINGIQPDDDYTMDLTEIQAGGNLSKGVTITIKANEDSKLVKNDTWTTVEVTFQSDTRKSLGDIDLSKITNVVVDNTKVTKDEADAARNNAPLVIQNKLNAKIDGIKEGTDYTIDPTSLNQIQAGNLSAGVTITIQAKEGSELVKSDTSTTIEVTFKTKPVEDLRYNLAKANLDTISVAVRDNTDVKNPEVEPIKEEIKKKVQENLDFLVEGTELGTDYKIPNLDVIKAGDLSKKINLSVQALPNSTKLQKKAIVSLVVLRTSREGIDLADLTVIDKDGKDIGLGKVYLESKNPAKIAADEVHDLRIALVNKISTIIQASVPGALAGIDFSIEQNKINVGNNLSSLEGIKFEVVGIFSRQELIKNGSKNFALVFFQEKR